MEPFFGTANSDRKEAAGMRMNSTMEENIRHRAYELYVQRGCESGHDIEDWLRAEAELRELSVAA